MTNVEKDAAHTPLHSGGADGGIAVLTPQMMEEFRDLFQEWSSAYPNAQCLEMGGQGDLESLARACLAWAKREAALE